MVNADFSRRDPNDSTAARNHSAVESSSPQLFPNDIIHDLSHLSGASLELARASNFASALIEVARDPQRESRVALINTARLFLDACATSEDCAPMLVRFQMAVCDPAHAAHFPDMAEFLSGVVSSRRGDIGAAVQIGAPAVKGFLGLVSSSLRNGGMAPSNEKTVEAPATENRQPSLFPDFDTAALPKGRRPNADGPTFHNAEGPVTKGKV